MAPRKPKPKTDTETDAYEVLVTHRSNGEWHEQGATLILLPAQAEYYVLNGKMKLKEAE